MAVRLDNSADYLSRATGFVDYNAAYTTMFKVMIVTDLNAYGHFHAITSVAPPDASGNYNNSDFVGVDGDGTTLRGGSVKTGTSAYPTGTNLTVGTSYHIAARRTSLTLWEVLLNGVVNLTDTTSVSGRAAAAGELMGTLHGGLVTNIRLSHFLQYNAALTDAEIRAQMNAEFPLRVANLTSFSPMRKGANERLIELIRRNNWTANGTLTDEDSPVLALQSRPSRRVFQTAGGGGGPVTYFQNVTAAVGIVPSLTRVSTRKRTITAPVATAPTMARRTTKNKALSAPVAAAVSIARRATKLKTLSTAVAAAVGILGTMARASARQKALSAAVAVAVSMARANVLGRALSAAVGVLGFVTNLPIRGRTLSAAVGTVPTMARRSTRARTLTAPVGVVATLSRRLTFFRSLSVAVALLPVLTRRSTRKRTLLAQAAAVASLSPHRQINRTLSAPVGVAPSLARRKTYGRALSVQVDTVPTVTRAKTFGRALSAIIGLIASMSRNILRANSQSGQKVRKTGPYSTTARSTAPYTTTVRNRGPYHE